MGVVLIGCGQESTYVCLLFFKFLVTPLNTPMTLLQYTHSIKHHTPLYYLKPER